MKFSMTVEYTEKEYIESTSAWSGLVRALVESMPKGGKGTVTTRVETQEEVVKEAATIPFTRPLGPVEVVPHEEVQPEPVVDKAVRKKAKQIKKGEAAFTEFVREWLEGIDHETLELVANVSQPDRDLLLRSYGNSPNAYPILLFVNSCGGLQQAVAKVTNSERLGLDLTRFIVPPASIAFPDLADLYEYSNPFNKDKEEE
jgi:hypothetical protein